VASAFRGHQALLLAHLRLGHTYAQLAAGFEVGVSTVCRYITEAVGLLAARAPDLATAATAALANAFVILDGTLLPIDQPHHSGKYIGHSQRWEEAGLRARWLAAEAERVGTRLDSVAC
jgi:hypothetical protein